MKTNETKPTQEERRQALRDAFGLITSALFLLGVGVPLMLLAARLYVHIFALDTFVPLSHGIGILLTMLLTLVLGGYIGICIWIVTARYLFRLSREDVLRCAHAGPRIPILSQFDDWLIDSIYRGSSNNA